MVLEGDKVSNGVTLFVRVPLCEGVIVIDDERLGVSVTAVTEKLLVIEGVNGVEVAVSGTDENGVIDEVRVREDVIVDDSVLCGVKLFDVVVL